MRIVFIILISLVAKAVFAQAVLSTAAIISDVEIYKDLKDKHKYYYAPGKLQLHYDDEGHPSFKLIEMRYTGRGVTGDQGEKRFMNIVQFKLIMEPIGKLEIQNLKNQLPPKVNLSPIALKNVEAFIVAPFEGTYKRIGKNGSFQSEGKKGENTKTSFWEERVFTVRLENEEAQILWDMVENGQIALSVSYAYYADIIDDTIFDFEVTGNDSTLVDLEESINENVEPDSIPQLSMIRSEAFNLDIDVVNFPDVLSKRDLNEGIPPSYPALEVLCYDFANELRPDLAMKTIEFEAMGLSNNTVKIKAARFLNTNSELHTRQIFFPYAVDMQKPLRYKIKEYSVVGDISDTGWITQDSWVGILDISSQVEDISFMKRELDIEVGFSENNETGVDEVSVILNYKLHEATEQKILKFKKDDLIPIKQIAIFCDKDADLKYHVVKSSSEGRTTSLSKQVYLDDYIYIDI